MMGDMSVEPEPAVTTDPSLLPAAEVAARQGVDPDVGLTAAEAAARLERHGPNRLQSAPPVPWWRRLAAQLADPLVVLLLVAVGVSLVAWLIEGAHGVPFDAVVIGLIVVANAVIGLVQEAKAADAVAALARMSAAHASVVRDGVVHRVMSEEVVPGDVLALAEGDTVAADARLVTSASLHVAEASLTGESEPVAKDPRPLAGPAALGDRTSMVFSGTAVTRGTGRAVVTATGMATQTGAIATLLETTEQEATPLQREVAGLGRMLGRAVIAIALVVVLTVLVTSDLSTLSDYVTVLLLGVSLAVAAVPEGLPAILSVVLAIGVRRMAGRNAIVKRLSSVETLGSASVICSDKTGTLTENEMTVVEVVTASGRVEVEGSGYDLEGRVVLPDAAGAGWRHEVAAVLGGGALANDARLADGGIVGDPTEGALLVAERKLGVAEERERRFERVGEVPFTSERKLMSVVVRDTGGAVSVVTKGAPDVLLDRCGHELVGEAEVALTAERRAAWLEIVAGLSDQALRTLGVAYRSGVDPVGGGGVEGYGATAGEGGGGDPAEASGAPAGTEGGGARASDGVGHGELDEGELERDLVLAGVVGIIDPPRGEVRDAIAAAHGAGIRVVMITGDHPRTALRIAQDLGITTGDTALAGVQLDALSAEEFADVVRHVDVFARVAPEHKLRIVDALQADGEIVAMTGDGVNDAPALKSADIGVAMGITGTEVTREAGSMILADDNFATIVEAVREGRGIFANIRKFLRYLLSSNMGEVMTVFAGVLLAGWLGLSGHGEAVVVPLLAVQILWINLLTDTAPALAMGVDPQTDDVMARPPRRLTDKVIDLRMWRGVLFTGVVMAAVTLLAIDVYLPGGLVEGTSDIAHARTAGFTVLVFAQLFNAFAARSETTSAFHGLWSNHWLWGAVALSAALQVAVVHVPVLQAAFGTAPLTGAQWLGCLALGSVVLVVSELRKLVLRRTGG